MLFKPTLLRPLRVPISRAFSTTPAIANIARMTLIGRLGADADLIPTSSGGEVVRYSVATSFGSTENRKTSWWKVQSFDPRPEAREKMKELLKKGTLVYVEGNAAMRKYEVEDGTVHNNLSITQVSYRILSNPLNKEAEVEGAEEVVE